jgi:hypothetical protein
LRVFLKVILNIASRSDCLGGNQRGNSIAVAIADSDNFIALKVLVSAESDIITAFLRRCRCPIAMNNADVEELFLVKM